MGIPKPIRCIFLVNRGPASDLYVNVLPLCFLCCIIPIARFMGPTWGPSGADRTQVGPMLSPWSLLSGMLYNKTHPYWGKCFSWHRDWCFHLGNVLIAFTGICYETGFNMKWWYFQLQQQWVLLKINTLRPGENGRHFPDDIFKCIFLNEDIWISIKFSLKFVPKGPIDNISALVQIMAWRRPGASHYLNQWWLYYRRIYGSLVLNELKYTTCDIFLDRCFVECEHLPSFC